MAAERTLLIGLVRVSTTGQADSGLGLDAQRAAIEEHRSRNNGDLIETYVEVESGAHNDIASRPKLRTAAEHAAEVGGTLVIAKLDRLVRSTSIMQYLKDSKCRFVACDNPHANELTIDILVAVAANEARMISQRTKDALRAYREGKRVSKRIRQLYPEGVPANVIEATAGKLGASLPQCRNLTPEARAHGTIASAKARHLRSRHAAEVNGRLVRGWLDEEPGLSLRSIARRLNERRRMTPRGKTWTATQVWRVLRRDA